MKINYLSLAPLLILAGCSSEYGPTELQISDNGAFVERGSDSLIDGTVVIEKVTGESLTVEFDGGLPNGEVEMRNAEGDPVLKSNFSAKQTQDGSRLGFLGSINERLEKSAGELKTDDYLDLFEGFAEYHGDYFRIDRNNKKIEGNYTSGEKTGHWQIYCENGQLESDRSYKQVVDNGKQSFLKVGKEIMNRCDGEVLLAATRDDDGLLQGKYVENASGGLFNRSSDLSEKPKPKYQRNYKDGELDGEQKEYDRFGLVSVENSFDAGVKVGVEKIYASNQDYSTKEVLSWLSEQRSYSNGQLNGSYVRYDSLKRVIESGQYQNDSPLGLWSQQDYKKYNKTLTDYNADNFILDKAKAFKEACSLPQSSWNTVNWEGNRQGKLSACEYYVENSVVDINKKIALDAREPFEKSSNWTYSAIVAAPKTYQYMKSHGLKTRVSDSTGRTRLHICLSQLRAQNRNYPRCSADQAITYIDDVNIDAVSNIGTALHQLSFKRSYSAKRANVVTAELKIAKALLEKGANIDQLNHKNSTALMDALSNAEYSLAELLLDAGASVSGTDVQGRSSLSHFFVTKNNRWRTGKIGAQGTRVLAKMVALGTDTSAPIWDTKTAKELSEENNTLHHIQTMKDANAMALEFRDTLKAKARQRQASLSNEQQQASVTEIETSTTSEEQTRSFKDLIAASEQTVEPNASENAQQVTDQKTAPTEQPQQLEQSTAEAATDETPSSSGQTETANQQQAEPTQNSDATTALLKGQADFLVSQANDHIANFRLKTPKSNSALGSLEQLIKIDPQNSNIPLIKESIGKKYLGLASKEINKGEKAAAQKHLDSASEFITDTSVLDEYATRVAATTKPRPASTTTQVADDTNDQRSTAKSTASSGIACKTRVQAIGVPMLGRTIIARQSLPLSKQVILDKSAEAIRQEYNNVRLSGDEITFEQRSKGKSIKFTLDVRRDGNNTQLSVTAKTPPGLVIKKANYKTAFCELITKL